MDVFTFYALYLFVSFPILPVFLVFIHSFGFPVVLPVYLVSFIFVLIDCNISVRAHVGM